MDFVDSIKKALKILMLKGTAMKEVALGNFVGHAFLILVITGLAGAVGQTLISAIIGEFSLLTLLAFIYLPILTILGSLIWAGIWHIIALIFGGQAKYMELFKAVAFAQIVGWVAIVPFIGTVISSILSIWLIVVSVVIVKNVHKLSTGRAVLVVLLPIIIIGVLALLGFLTFVAALFGATA